PVSTAAPTVVCGGADERWMKDSGRTLASSPLMRVLSRRGRTTPHRPSLPTFLQGSCFATRCRAPKAIGDGCKRSLDLARAGGPPPRCGGAGDGHRPRDVQLYRPASV